MGRVVIITASVSEQPPGWGMEVALETDFGCSLYLSSGVQNPPLGVISALVDLEDSFSLFFLSP